MPLAVNNGVVITTENYKETLELKTHPVGTIFITSSDDNPADLFGGDWTKVIGRTLMGAAPEDGSFSSASMAQDADGYWYYADAVGNKFSFRVKTQAGTPNVSLTNAEMPSHNHMGVYVNNTLYSCGIGQGVEGFLRLTTDWQTSNINSELHTGYSGGGGAHNNLPPYYAVYIWERIG